MFYLALFALALSDCKSNITGLSEKTVTLTDLTFEACTTPLNIQGPEKIATITSCQFVACQSESDDGAVSFYGLCLRVRGSCFRGCEASGKCSAVGAKVIGSLSGGGWTFEGNEVFGGLCDRATCGFEFSLGDEGLGSMVNTNMSSNEAEHWGSMLWIESSFCVLVKFCEMKMNCNHNGIRLSDIRNETLFRFVLFSSNRCIRTDKSTITGLFSIEGIGKTTLKDCAFVQNEIECLVSGGEISVFDFFKFDGCVFDVPVSKWDCYDVTIATTKSIVERQRKKEMVSPLMKLGLILAGDPTRRHRTRLPSRTPAPVPQATGEDDSGFTCCEIFGIVVGALIGASLVCAVVVALCC
jgi:hypothetical protein